MLGKNGKIDKRKKISFCLIVLMILGLFSYSFARYRSSIKGSSLIEIAKPIMEVRGEQSMIISALQPKNVYYFSIRNYNEQGSINEAQMEYQIEIISTLKEGVQMQLYEQDKEIPLEDNKTTTLSLGKEEKEEKKYALHIQYQVEKNLKQTEEEAVIEIKIHSIQKKM